MIYLKLGVTQSIWLSLQESAPVGSTGSYRFQFTNDVSGQTKVFYPTDLNTDNKWSRYEWSIGTPENLAGGKFDMRPGMWDYKITDSEVLLETGKILVEESIGWRTVDRPVKNNNAVKR